jgi:hypothetical protein
MLEKMKRTFAPQQIQLTHWAAPFTRQTTTGGFLMADIDQPLSAYGEN